MRLLILKFKCKVEKIFFQLGHSNHRSNLFTILLHHHPLYFCSPSISVIPALCHSFFSSLSHFLSLSFLQIFVSLYILSVHDTVHISNDNYFTGFLKSALNQDVLAFCSNITHFTAMTDAGSVSSST